MGFISGMCFYTIIEKLICNHQFIARDKNEAWGLIICFQGQKQFAEGQTSVLMLSK